MRGKRTHARTHARTHVRIHNHHTGVRRDEHMHA
jgi:hypothetical protein